VLLQRFFFVVCVTLAVIGFSEIKVLQGVLHMRVEEATDMAYFPDVGALAPLSRLAS
jgi:hypothetical protein